MAKKNEVRENDLSDVNGGGGFHNNIAEVKETGSVINLGNEFRYGEVDVSIENGLRMSGKKGIYRMRTARHAIAKKAVAGLMDDDEKEFIK